MAQLPGVFRSRQRQCFALDIANTRYSLELLFAACMQGGFLKQEGRKVRQGYTMEAWTKRS
jgi:hypothetical protein